MRASSEQLPLLLVSASGRALAQSAASSGLPVVVLDLFNDLDVRELSVASRGVAAQGGKFDARRLLATARNMCPPESCAGLVYGSGLEGRSRLLAASEQRPHTVRQCRRTPLRRSRILRDFSRCSIRSTSRIPKSGWNRPQTLRGGW